jgi:hypothetical protein
MTTQNASLPALLIYAQPRGRRGDHNILDGSTHKIIGEINLSGPGRYHAKLYGEFVGIYGNYIDAFLALKNKVGATQC